MEKVEKKAVQEMAEVKQKSQVRDIIKGIWERPLALIGFIVISIFLFTALFAPLLVPHNPYSMDLPNRHLPPLSQVTRTIVDYTQEDPDLMFTEEEVIYVFGTDHGGRCIFSRVIMGARLSLMIGVVVVVIRFVLGIPLGLLAGFSGGRFTDTLIMRIADGFVVFPDLLLALGVMAVRGPGIENIFFALAITGWTGVARITRAETLSLRERDFVQASRALGATKRRILFRHILPNAAAPLLVMATLGLAGPILGEAALSFLGLGAQPPQISWGRMIAQARSQSPIIRGRWWQMTFPGLAIFFVVMGFNLLGDGLRDILDPRMKGGG